MQLDDAPRSLEVLKYLRDQNKHPAILVTKATNDNKCYNLDYEEDMRYVDDFNEYWANVLAGEDASVEHKDDMQLMTALFQARQAEEEAMEGIEIFGGSREQHHQRTT